MKLFLDVNVILDVLTDRRPFAEHSAAVLAAIERGRAEGCVAAHAVTTIFYLVEKHAGQKKAKRAVMDLLKLVTVVPVDHDRLLHALGMNWSDYEDAVQAACAAKADVDYLVTRNREDFSGADVDVISPAELSALLPPGRPEKP